MSVQFKLFDIFEDIPICHSTICVKLVTWYYCSACKYLDPPSYEVTGEPSVEMKDLQAKTWCNLALSGMGIELCSDYLFCILCM